MEREEERPQRKRAKQQVPVLYVEDDPEEREGLEWILRRHFEPIYVGEDGQQGLELFHKHQPQLVITDIQMPNMSGLRMAREIKKAAPEIPIVITTAYSDIKYLMEAIELGIDGYVKKPIDRHRLMKVIENHLNTFKIQERLKESEKRYRTLVESSPHPMVIVDKKRVLFANQAAMEVLGMRREEELVGREGLEFVPETDRKVFRDRLLRIIRGGEPFTGDAQLLRNDGESLTADLSAIAYEYEGSPAVLLTFRDITERKRMEEKLRQQEQLLMQQSKLAEVGQMIAAIGHQWEQPLTSIALVVQTLEYAQQYGELKPEEVEEVVQEVNQQVAFMSSAISDLKNFLKPSKGATLFNVSDAVQEVVVILDHQLKHHVIDLAINGAPPEAWKGEKRLPSIMVEGYNNEFKHVMLNILNNAKEAIWHRFGKKGGKEGTGKGRILVAIGERDGKAEIVVEDNGGGIDPVVLDHIFEQYYTTKGEQGTGIGLYMAKLIIENKMGGTITGENGAEGARFTMLLKKSGERPS